jgi:transketolase
VARTVKGQGAPAVADREGQHGRPLDDPEGAIEALGGVRVVQVEVAPPPGDGVVERAPANTSLVAPEYALGSAMSTRRAYGEALAALGSERGDIVYLDAEVKNSTYADLFAQAHPERYIEVFIAEQQLVATAVAAQVRGWTPYASTFAAFQARSYDFVRMAAVSRANVKLVGSHAGVSVGEDGPSQMGLEDLAMFRAVLGSTVLYPCDANQTAWLVDAMADLDGIVYLRTTREATPVIYAPGEAFGVGGSRVLHASNEDRATIVGAGITVHEALTAASQLADEGVAVRVIDAYSVKPIDAETLRIAAVETGRIVTVEDHQAEGGLGEAVLSALAALDAHARVRVLAVRELPGSGQPVELRGVAGIDAAHITEAVRDLLADG